MFSGWLSGCVQEAVGMVGVPDQQHSTDGATSTLVAPCDTVPVITGVLARCVAGERLALSLHYVPIVPIFTTFCNKQ